ncbi:uracil-DNA glycosylase [Ancylomarina sp. 16SWW S1-10-2]|uniref:uracil-DNA glycosylase n=1 Tax=Ancylomarina sp. 16SWW S1-10-2 TaxID=2499681 RepID=UPI0012ADE465|nr:uracil-DNA glycosylase [Ancylomarina sp. 16SWW S1-10-2]MRT92517.1 uracil-DNA glycosylase [Ancylomarina sp. 16SWW S1-10-2]
MGQINLSEKQILLNTINSQIKTCENCKLSLTRQHALTGEGNINARIMFIALSPGTKEDTANKMFIGPSGKVFNRLLQAAQIERESVFMTNLIKCTLPKNRKPKQKEIESCSYILDEEIKIIKPEIIVPLGYYASRSILTKYKANASELGMSFKDINGQLLFLNGMKIFPITHPSALLYNPSFEPQTIEYYVKLKSLL